MMVPLSEIISSLESGVSVNGDDRPSTGDQPGVLKVSSIANGHFYPNENKAILMSEVSRATASVRAGDLLVSRANTFDLVGSCCLVDKDYPHLFLPDKLWRVVVRDPGRDCVQWLNHVLNSPGVRQELKTRATGTSGSMKNIPQWSFLAIRVHRPPYREQKALAVLFSSWDRGIRQLADLIAAKIRFKQGLMQQVLTGKRLFNGYQDAWSSVRLRDVATECDERNRGRLGVNNVMGVTKAEGIVPMRERTIGADIARYLVVKKNWFAYNPMRINIGSIARWQGERDILVSPDYVVFRCNEANDHSPGVDPDFLDHLRRSGIWENFVTAAGNGSVRVRIYFGDLGLLKFKLPSMPEQQKIATFLNAVDREIDLLREQLEALKQQKKGLMQKLLTGEVRVMLPEEVA